MEIRPFTFEVSPSIGTVSGTCMIAEKSKCIITLAHGAGAGMDHIFMSTLASSLSENGISTMRFNFPFAENKKGRPDLPAVAHKTIEAAIGKAKEFFEGIPLFIAGKSFGGRMSSQYISLHPDVAVKGIIFYGFPLHPPGKPSVERADHLRDIQIPMLFLQGTKDELAKLHLVENLCSSLKQATLIKIEGANHAFKAGKQNIIQVLSDATEKWVKNLL
ncbi:MAG: alpha/beta family hydrolase [Ginsengibacter sp.]